MNGFSGGAIIPPAQLGRGTRDGTRFLRDDGTYQVPVGFADPTTTAGDLIVRAGSLPGVNLIPGATSMTVVGGDSNSYTVGNEFSSDITRTVDTLAWYRYNATDVAPTRLDLWDTTTGSIVASIIAGITDSGSAGWQHTTFSGGYTLVAGRRYRVTMIHPVGQYSKTSTIPVVPDSGLTFYGSSGGGSYYNIGSSPTYPTLGTATLVGVSIRTASTVGSSTRLPVGTDGQVLTADSAQTLGVAYGVPGGLLTLTDAATISWAATVAAAQVTLGGNRTLAAPTSLRAGATYTLIVIQDATGSRTLTWNAVFKFPGATAPTLTTTANAKDVFTFVTDGTNLYRVAAALDVR